MGSWVPLTASIIRGTEPNAPRALQLRLLAGQQRAVREVFDGWFGKGSASGPELEGVLRGMHERIVEAGYSGFMAGKPNTTVEITPGQMIKDFEGPRYRHPLLTRLDRSEVPLLEALRKDLERYPNSRKWHARFEGIAKKHQPFTERSFDPTGLKVWLSHSYAPVSVHDAFIDLAASSLGSARTQVRAAGSAGQRIAPMSAEHLELVDHLGSFHQALLAPQLFERVNNSVYLTAVNRVLTLAHLPQITPGSLDEYAIFEHPALGEALSFRTAFREAAGFRSSN